MKKILCLALALVLCLALACCAVAEGNWKIAILTGTASQGEEEIRAAERAIATYGAEHVITDTYPDAFASETETTISKLVAFASDPEVKAIVMCQAVPGASAGFNKIRWPDRHPGESWSTPARQSPRCGERGSFPPASYPKG